MTEEFVTLETAKLLKAAGFKEDVSSFYELVYKGGSGPEYEIDESYDAQNYNTDVYSISAPTQSIAQKWLRETKNLHVLSTPKVVDCEGLLFHIYEIQKFMRDENIEPRIMSGNFSNKHLLLDEHLNDILKMNENQHYCKTNPNKL